MNTALKTATVIIALSQFYSTVSHAGFEYSGRAPSIVSNSEKNMSSNAPMPIVDIQSEDTRPVLGNPAIQNIEKEEVYIKRGQTVSLAPKDNEAIDSKNLLNAVEQGNQIDVVSPQNSEEITWNGNASSSSENRLVINPYPLQDQASHNSAGQLASLDQAMMEQTGMLRPVMTPGKNRAMAMIDRSSRLNGNQKTQPIVSDFDSIAASPAKVEAMKLTPIPGGEAPPIKNMIRVEGRVSKAVEDKPAPLNQNPLVQKEMMDADEPKQNIIPSVAVNEKTTSSAEFAVAAGFGRDLPLALALSQVVPAGYSYVFDQSVDTGAVVTWQGGKPWNEVLNDMLRSSNMMAEIQNNQVIIKNIRS